MQPPPGTRRKSSLPSRPLPTCVRSRHSSCPGDGENTLGPVVHAASAIARGHENERVCQVPTMCVCM
eukprot:4701874-Pleurochrysis_carterae.AAC.5